MIVRNFNLYHVHRNDGINEISIVARCQFFMKLIDNKFEDILLYYSNPSNWQSIQDKIDKYFELSNKDNIKKRMKML